MIGIVIAAALGILVPSQGIDTILAPGETSPDSRHLRARTLNDTDFDFSPPPNANAWKARSADLRAQVQIAVGLYPWPAKTPLKASIRPGVKRDGYEVQRVVFESLPGHLVTGNLYVPTGPSNGPRPAVLCPHGHWTNGRFLTVDAKSREKEMKSGAEKTPEGAQSPLQARCAQLARMGCVVLHHDMIGYADSGPIEHRGGFTQAETLLRLHGAMMLQTWNCIRALDFLVELPGVDPARIGVTGASGGGTQTFILGALDPRPSAVFPAVMVGTRMQGGCVCENAPFLRVATGNVEIAALFAPKPMALSGANDWTVAIETHGLPQLRSLYGMLGSPANISGKCWPEFGHNYNQVSRESMYNWFNKHLKLGAQEPVKEQPFVLATKDELSVWDAEHKRPPSALGEAELLLTLAKAEDSDLKQRFPSDAGKARDWKKHMEPVAKVLLGGPLPSPDSFRVEIKGTRPLTGGAVVEAKWLKRLDDGAAVPALFLRPARELKTVRVVIHPMGKKALFNNGSPTTEVAKGLAGGIGFLAVDLLGTGESPPAKAKVDAKFPPYTWCYNRPLITERVRDTLLALAHAKDQGKPVELDGIGTMGPVALLARAAAGDLVSRSEVELEGFSFSNLKDAAHPHFLPGSMRYGDLGGLACAGPVTPLTLVKPSANTAEWIKAYHLALGADSPVIKAD